MVTLDRRPFMGSEVSDRVARLTPGGKRWQRRNSRGRRAQWLRCFREPPCYRSFCMLTLPLTDSPLGQNDVSLNRHCDLTLCRSMIFSENRFPLFAFADL